jgi:hypothetical protein
MHPRATITFVALPSNLPRLWPTTVIPGILEGMWTYRVLDLDAMPPVERSLDGTLDWLLRSPAQPGSLAGSRDDPTPTRVANTSALRGLGLHQRLPDTFRAFVKDPEPRRHLRSATACYLDLGKFPVVVSDGGVVVHFLSDQQWVVHWLLYAGTDGSEAVLATADALGFDVDEGDPVRMIDVTAPPQLLAVCSDSFEEFLYRYWAMNELFFQLAIDGKSLDQLPDELRAYAARYPRKPSALPFF